jgi:hypothetical protein
MSIPGRDSTAAMLVRAGFVVVLVPVNVSGFRPVLARGWHGAGCFLIAMRRRRAVVRSGYSAAQEGSSLVRRVRPRWTATQAVPSGPNRLSRSVGTGAGKVITLAVCRLWLQRSLRSGSSLRRPPEFLVYVSHEVSAVDPSLVRYVQLVGYRRSPGLPSLPRSGPVG